jgi:hypothetical protein
MRSGGELTQRRDGQLRWSGHRGEDQRLEVCPRLIGGRRKGLKQCTGNFVGAVIVARTRDSKFACEGCQKSRPGSQESFQATHGTALTVGVGAPIPVKTRLPCSSSKAGGRKKVGYASYSAGFF